MNISQTSPENKVESRDRNIAQINPRDYYTASLTETSTWFQFRLNRRITVCIRTTISRRCMNFKKLLLTLTCEK